MTREVSAIGLNSLRFLGDFVVGIGITVQVYHHYQHIFER